MVMLGIMEKKMETTIWGLKMRGAEVETSQSDLDEGFLSIAWRMAMDNEMEAGVYI